MIWVKGDHQLSMVLVFRTYKAKLVDTTSFWCYVPAGMLFS